MARLEKPPIGKLKGRLGNIVGRFFGTEHYISLRPRKYVVKKKLRKVPTKLKFSNGVNIARYLVKLPELQQVWNKCNMQGKRGYNRIISANYHLFKDNIPTTENIITPKGRALFFEISDIDKKGMRYSYNMAGFIKPPFYLKVIFIYFNPIISGCGLVQFDEHQETIIEQNSETFKNGNYKSQYFDHSFLEKSFQFKNVILYAAVIGTSTIKDKKWWTSTVAIDLSKYLKKKDK